MKFTEEKLERVFIELLGEEKISYIPGYEISSVLLLDNYCYY